MSNTSNASKNVKRFLLLFALGIAYGFMYVMPYMKSSFYDQMIAAMGCTNAQLGSLMTAYCICCTVSYLPGGWIGDKFNPKPVLLISIFGQAALSFLFMFTYKSYTMAVIIWLRSGPMADWQVPGSFPFTPTYAFGDMATSSAFLSGILMALIGKKSTGMGTFVSTSLFASGIWCNAIGVVSHQPQFGGERPNDPLRPADPFCHFYQCSDGKWIGVFDNEYRRELPKFANLFGMPEIADDPRAASLEALHETDFVVEIVTRLNAIFKTKTVAEWEAFLSENNVSCERMRTIRDVSTDEQAIANGYIQKVTFKDDLEVMMPCPPMQFTEYAMRPYTSAGRLGADTDSIFHDLGYTDSEIAAMKDSGAIQ